jgi:hypothetical protein
MKSNETIQDKISAAEALGSMWLARFNELNEAGKGQTKKAEHCLERSQRWLDKSTELRGWGAG